MDKNSNTSAAGSVNAAPIDADAEPAAVGKAPAAGERAKPAVLVVDDDAKNRFAMKRTLEPLGADIEAVESGEAALSQMLRRDFAVVLLDVQMPGMDGFEAASLMRGNDATSHVPIILVTDISTEERYVFKGYDAGAVDYLFKPVDPHILRAKVKVFLQLYSQSRALDVMAELQRSRDALERSNQELTRRQEELVETRRRVVRQNEEMQQFVYTVSHDLKAPLVTMKGFVGLLAEELAEAENDEIVDAIRRIDKAASHMTRLIDDLLELSRAGRVRGEMELVDLSVLLRELAEELRPRLEELGATLEVRGEMPRILADRTGLSRVFENLLNNALKYGCRGPEARIVVGSEVLDGELRCFVKDNGPGIDPEYHQKIFELFQRLESDQDGTGVGLAIVAKILLAHQGRAWVESSPGEGATFWLSFGTAAPTAAEATSVN